MIQKKRRPDNVVSIHTPHVPEQQRSQKVVLSPAVRRRRLIWLLVMLSFFAWTAAEIITQSGQIAKKNEELSEVESRIKALQEEQKSLQTEIKKLQNEEYVLELAREKYQYYFPSEVPYKGK